MRIFALIGALLMAGGVFLLVDSGLRVSHCVTNDLFSWTVWSEEFWLLVPSKPDLGMSPNAHWFLRLIGGVIVALLGLKILRTATR